jgi:hypothetical protein
LGDDSRGEYAASKGGEERRLFLAPNKLTMTTTDDEPFGPIDVLGEKKKERTIFCSRSK